MRVAHGVPRTLHLRHERARHAELAHPLARVAGDVGAIASAPRLHVFRHVFRPVVVVVQVAVSLTTRARPNLPRLRLLLLRPLQDCGRHALTPAEELVLAAVDAQRGDVHAPRAAE